MATPEYLAFDLGASSGRAVIGTLDGAAMQMREVHRFRTPLVDDGGHLYWDHEVLLREVREGLAKALALAPELRSVSVDSWAVDYVPLGADGEPLRRPYAYRDPRAKGRTAEACRLVGGADTLYARTGTQFKDVNTLPQVLADLANEPEIVARTKTRLLIADYVLYRLSGEVIAERTMASTTQLLDPVTGEWATDVIAAVGDDPARWPRVVAAGTVLGSMRRDVMPSGWTGTTPLVVASCSHDTGAAVAAVPAAMGRSWAYISAGTWSPVGAELEAPVLTPNARAFGFTNELGLDGTVRLLKNLTGMWVLEECMREWAATGERPAYEALMAEAELAPHGAHTLDLDASEFGDRGDMVAKLDAACRRARVSFPTQRGGIVRLILASLAASYNRTLGQLEALTGERAAVIHIVGGGARNRLLGQLTAVASGRRVVAGPQEAAALGNLLVQARSLGDLPGSLSIREAARNSTRLTDYDAGPGASAGRPALSTT